MNARLGLVVGCAVALVGTLGCGDDDDAAKGGLGIDDLPAAIADRACAEIEDCYDARSLDALFGKDGCIDRFIAQLEDGDFAHLQDAVDEGSVDYDGKQAEQCIAKLEGLGCAFGTTRMLAIDACEMAFQGHVELDDDCNIDAECEGKAVCVHAGSCPGKCSKLLGPGDACERSDECEDGLACDDSSKCAAPATVQKPCGGGVAAECKPGLACIGADDAKGTAGTCRSLDSVFSKKLGDTCDYDTGMLCEDGLSCVVDAIVSGKPTLVCAKPSASGAACKFGAPSPCPRGEYCSANISLGQAEGTCMALPAAGEACTSLTGAPKCDEGLLCDDDDRCHPINRLGQPCVSDEGCSSKHCASGRCERPEVCDL